jgi:hypothetical protein
MDTPGGVVFDTLGTQCYYSTSRLFSRVVFCAESSAKSQAQALRRQIGRE